MKSETWDEANVSRPSWSGTIQIDQKSTGNARIEELVGLSRDEWMVVGVDIWGGERSYRLKVLAVKRSDALDSGDVIPGLADRHGGEIPATEFLVHGVDPFAILKAMTHEISLRLRARVSRDYPIQVVARGDVDAPKATK